MVPGVRPCGVLASLPTMQSCPTQHILAGWPGSPAPSRPPLCPMAEGRVLLPSAGLGRHGGAPAPGTWLEQVRVGRGILIGWWGGNSIAFHEVPIG